MTQNPTPKSSSSGEFTLFDPMKNSSTDIPDVAGNYIVCLKMGSNLPDIGIEHSMKTYQNLQVIYTGIAGKSLRKRDYRQHFTGNNAGSSTLRKSIGSLFDYPKIPRDRDPSNGKTKFTVSDEIRLSDWMESNLVLFFKINTNPNELEDQLIAELNPPLNISKNKNLENKDYRSKLSQLRSRK
jgi:hypothetical protein